MFCLGSVEKINKHGFVLSFMYCSGEKYYWPSLEKKNTQFLKMKLCVASLKYLSQSLNVVSLFQIIIIIIKNTMTHGLTF